jgi:predicted heme/steroid binding protein
VKQVKLLGEQPRKITMEELAKNNGQNGNPAYIAYKGKVYDVSISSFWMGGDHLGSHQAGKDLTAEIDLAPHGPENLDRMKVVGDLTQ